jgi:FkbM family methyltransferase
MKINNDAELEKRAPSFLRPSIWDKKCIEKYSPEFEKNNLFYTKIKNQKKFIKLVDYGNKNTYKKLYNEASKYCDVKNNAIDIGCRYGEFTRYLVRSFKKIYCFDYRKSDLFAMNIDVQNKNILHYARALGRDSYKVYASGRGNLNSGNTDPKWKKFWPVKVYTLDSFLLNDVSLIKVDVDGMDEDVLVGAKHTISKWQPVIIVEEIMEQNGLPNHNAVALLKDLGYKIAYKHAGPTQMHIDYVMIPHNRNITA